MLHVACRVHAVCHMPRAVSHSAFHATLSSPRIVSHNLHSSSPRSFFGVGCMVHAPHGMLHRQANPSAQVPSAGQAVVHLHRLPSKPHLRHREVGEHVSPDGLRLMLLLGGRVGGWVHTSCIRCVCAARTQSVRSSPRRHVLQHVVLCCTIFALCCSIVVLCCSMLYCVATHHTAPVQITPLTVFHCVALCCTMVPCVVAWTRSVSLSSRRHALHLVPRRERARPRPRLSTMTWPPSGSNSGNSRTY